MAHDSERLSGLVSRREFVLLGVIAAGSGLAGCTQKEEPASPQKEGSASPGQTPAETPVSDDEYTDPEIHDSYTGDPYADVDWETYGRHRGMFHTHPHYGDLGSPHEIYDHYVNLGYDVINLQPKSGLEKGMPWPLEELEEIHEDWENRYPADDGVVAIPGAEFERVQHLTSLFTEVMQDTIGEWGNHHSLDDQYETMREIVSSNPVSDTVEPLGFIAHPQRYKDQTGVDGVELEAEWDESQLEHYCSMFEDFSNCLGLEVLSYGGASDDRPIWDDLLTEFAPQRPIIGTSVDDPSNTDDFNRGWVTFYLSDDEFTPSDQRATQTAIYDAFKSGQTTFTAASGDPDEVPIIEAIEHDTDAGTISIESSGYDVTEWVSNGNVIETGEVIDYANHDDVDSYLRAQFHDDHDDPECVTCTQAWMIS